MKKALLIAATLISSSAAIAQNDTYRYHFNGGLNETYSKGPVLTAQCAGIFASEALPAGLSKTTYRFNTGCGLVYNDAVKNFIASGTYTIELYFRLDTISGYKKLVDFDSLKQDAGIYNQSGKLVLYPSFTSADSFMGAGAYEYLAITRDGATKKMYLNANGKTKGTYIDATDLYKLGTNKLLTFFRDDIGTNGEQSKGAVAMIQLSNYAIDSATIKSNYTLLSHTLGILGTSFNADEAIISPNPATGILHVAVLANCNYNICDITGRMIKTGSLQHGANSILLYGFPKGQYLLKIANIDASKHGTYLFTCQ